MNNITRFTAGLLAILALAACDNANLVKTLSGTVSSGSINPDSVSTNNLATLTQASSSTPVKKEQTQSKAKAKKKLPKSAFKTVQWTDLMPADDLDALLNPPSYITDIEDGSVEDQISNQIQNTIAAAGDDRYQQALVSSRVINEMDGQAIRIPGFIVPLEFDDDQTITQFFLVPFFGACIHVPPPPPNQIIFVDFPEGIKLEALYDPFWISGVVNTSFVENDVASAAYSLDMQHYERYTE